MRCSKHTCKERKRSTYPLSQITIIYIYIFCLYFTKNFPSYYFICSPKLPAEARTALMKSILLIGKLRHKISMPCLRSHAEQYLQNQTRICSRNSLVVLHLSRVAFMVEASSTDWQVHICRCQENRFKITVPYFYEKLMSPPLHFATIHDTEVTFIICIFLFCFALNKLFYSLTYPVRGLEWCFLSYHLTPIFLWVSDQSCYTAHE